MMPNFTVRKATTRDLGRFFPTFIKSLRQQFPEYSRKTIDYFIKKEYSKKALKGYLKSKDIILMAQGHRGEILGYLVATKPYGGVSFCSWVAVFPETQGQGVASKLLTEWEKLVKKQGCHNVQLWTVARNKEFYQKRGYKLIGRIPGNFYGTDDYFFYKLLQKPKEDNFLR